MRRKRMAALGGDYLVVVVARVNFGSELLLRTGRYGSWPVLSFIYCPSSPQFSICNATARDRRLSRFRARHIGSALGVAAHAMADSLKLPSPEALREIAARQDARCKEIQAARKVQNENQEQQAAELIQRNYRGYRARRQLKGIGLDSSTRWIEVRPPLIIAGLPHPHLY